MPDMEAATAAFGRNDWAGTLELLGDIGDDDERGLEMVATAAWWLDQMDAAMRARERLYELRRRRGDSPGAASAAIRLAWDSTIGRRDAAVARAWTARATALLAGQPPSAEHAWRDLRAATLDTAGSDVFAAIRQLAVAVGAFDAEMTAVCLQGNALVAEGRIEEGLRLMDEAALAACTGELDDPLAVTFACCQVLGACSRVRDFDRARQWCDRITDICEQRNIWTVLTVSRCMYAPILIARGHYAEAERFLEAAIAHYQSEYQHHAAEAIVWLAALRLRQGRIEEARALIRRAEPHPTCRLVLAGVCLQAGDAQAAAEHARAFLRQSPEDGHMERLEAYELLVRAESMAGNAPEAEAAMPELSRIAEMVGSEPGRASELHARAAIDRVNGALGEARAHLEDAADMYERGAAPYEAAVARIELGGVLDALDRGADAQREQARGEKMLRTLRRTTSNDGPLTPRELEVVRLVAAGLSNSEIADRLVISPHTAHRHVANVLKKLDATSRTGAVTRASALGLI
jgi:LuxR family maltose regulon positive regulatory protein